MSLNGTTQYSCVLFYVNMFRFYNAFICTSVNKLHIIIINIIIITITIISIIFKASPVCAQL